MPSAAKPFVRTTPPLNARRVRATLDLPCPECGGRIRLAREELADGAVAPCRHCGFAATITREVDGHGEYGAWILVDPDADLDEERRA